MPALPFVLDDGYGRCLLFPQKAEIITRRDRLVEVLAEWKVKPQLYLITNILPEVLAARYRWASLLHPLAWLGLLLVVQIGF